MKQLSISVSAFTSFFPAAALSALTEKGYDVNYCWGIGTHSNKQGSATLPEMLRWLWHDYPRPDDPLDESNRKLFVPVENLP